MKKEKSDIIEDITKMLLAENNDAARNIIVKEYPHKAIKVEKRKYTMSEKMEQFLSDGFIDRYTGKRLINPGMLKVISTYFPDEFPFHPHWKMTKTHIAFWELIPTIDHIYPIAKGGHDDKENRVTTSMKNNSIKSNYTIDEINWELYPKGNLIDWDGLTSLFVEIVNKDKELLKDNYIRNWYNISKKY
ncbi:MAG: HNH endonuclease [Acutalibacteraceae bacterium]